MQQVATVHGGEPNPLDSTGLCLLSLDGGGVRGLSTLYILKGLMDRLNQTRPEGSPAKKPCEVFDLIGGTSTGGLIAIMLGRLEMDIDDCIMAYIKLMKMIFDKPSKRGLLSIFGKIEPRFDANKLENAINEVINNHGAKPTDLFNDQADRSCRVFVCSITQETKEIVRLRSYPIHNKPGIPATICQAARATSAATTFFEPVSIGARRFADGALGANNPVDEVEGEASDIWCEDTGDLKPLVKCFISIGTGHPGKKAMEDNLLKFVSKTLPALATQTEHTEKQFIAKWRQHYDSKRYFRFNVDQGLQDVGLAEYQEQGLIESATEGYLDHQAVAFRVRDCVENLKSKQGATNFHFNEEIRGYQKRLAVLEQWQGRARWQVPFERNTRFTSRAELLSGLTQKLERKSDATRKIAIIGLGGVGKTQLVLELAYRIREQYAVYWIAVNSLANLQKAYRKVAQNLRLPGCDEIGVDILELVHSYLSVESIGPWLLIFDNADDIDLWTSPLISEAGAKRLIDYMPRSRHGAIIWTTRDRKMATEVARENVVTVQQMDESGASDMMRNYLIYPSRIKNYEDLLPGLLRKLTYLPLAIVQAAAYINVTGESLKHYEALLSNQDDEAIELLSEHFEDDGRYGDMENAVAKTWLISFEQIRRRSSLAFEYLGFMACVDPKDIPRSLLPPSERSSQKKQSDAIGILDAFSFITRHEDGSAFDIHRLVHLVTRGWLKRNGTLSFCHEQAVVRLGELLSDINEANRIHWRPYIAHAQHAVGKDDKCSREKVNLAERCGNCLYYDGRYREAETMCQITLEYRERVRGPEHPNTLTSVNNLGLVLNMQGKYAEAEALYRRALQDREKVQGPEHPDTLTSVNNLGFVLNKRGKYTEAEALYRRALQGREKVLGREHPDTLISVNNLGLVLNTQGKYTEAEALYRRALQGQEKVQGPEHPNTLTSVNNLGFVLDRQGKYTEAEALYQRALQGQEKVQGLEHPDTLTSVNNLSTVLNIQGKYTEAEALCQRALQCREKVLGPEHPDTLISFNNLGLFLDNQSKYAEAEALYRRALQGQEKVQGPEHPDTLTSVNNLSTVLNIQGKYTEAEALCQRALQGREKVLGREYPDTLTSVNNLGLVLHYQGKYTEAEALYRRALQGREKVLGREHPDTLISVNNLGLVLYYQGKYTEAEALCRRALQGQEKVLGREHPRTLTSASNLDSVLSHQVEEAKATHRNNP
ncbi:FabD/lysophospholipase-like protein [Penicillium cf. griseofulvum]|uniref:FabD/lysophospholipase-like protein n=1 Tax=Penicillium cf. griseofulvum TaxID=2972120 RepID=A0A9W9MTZ3_9EURO|nr:FabD/lysophospholipase-like protein [Penicillium cf. griseofulvum]KAJ5445837.1 FabD/lysophospholipase-like protein [Penicillium cf. griseofulvum]KAJ5447558.1 FabD/lysophospholipase-like protein [Penicillium cf. griseofulvum]